jgi:pre-mRNA-splicing factor 38A
MANRTDPAALSVHGTNPQNLIEKILRNRIYSNNYWKEHCFGLTAATLVDKAVKLRSYGGTYGGLKTPTPFICLVLKMLQIQPEKEIIVELITNPEYKYVRVLGAFYLRLVGKPKEIYEYLEPLYNDYRKIRERIEIGYKVTHMDEFIEQLLHGDYVCDIALPYLPKRSIIEESEGLPPRKSGLDLDEEDESESESEEKGNYRSRSNSPQRQNDREKESKEDKFGRNVRKRSLSPDRRENRDSYRDEGAKDRDRRDRDREDRRDRTRDDRDKDRDRKDRGRDYDRDRDSRRDRDRDYDRGRDRDRNRYNDRDKP